jgi:carboxyvinyl-carboxyphosphonate phosphorylmutase
MSFTERRTRLRRILHAGECVYPASVFDPISARIAESAGFEVAMLAGSVASAIVLSAPDLVVLTLSELAEQVRRISRASPLSLIVDADHGYGNALNVSRTVQELEQAGAAGLTVEDTVLPEPFGEPNGERLVPIQEFVGKLKAAVAARADPSLVVIGRTAAPRVAGMQEARARVQACVASGVDAVFLVGVRERREIEVLGEATSLPLLLGTIPAALDDRDFLAAHGVRAALQGHIPFLVMVKSLYDAYRQLATRASPDAMKDQTASQEQMDLVLRVAEYTRRRRDYMGKN